MKITRKNFTNLLLLLLAAGVFILIGVRTDWNRTLGAVKSANFTWIGLSALVMLGSHFLRGLRWNMLTEPAGYPLRAVPSFYSVLAGYLVNVGTSRGGEVVRCALTARSENAPVAMLVGTVVTERIVDLIMLMLVCIITLQLQYDLIYGFFDTYLFQPVANHFSPAWGIMIVLIIAAGIFGLLWLKKNKKKKQAGDSSESLIQKFSGGLRSIFQLKSPLLFILLSAGIWTGYWFGGYCLLQSLSISQHLGLTHALGLLVFSAIGVAIPLPAGAGVWGALSFGLATVYGMAPEQAETFGIFNVAFSNLFNIVFGALGYLLLWVAMQKQQPDAA